MHCYDDADLALCTLLQCYLLHTRTQQFHVQLKSGLEDDSSGKGRALFDAVYSNRERLEAIFRFFDEDCNGSISREEFRYVL
jgi:EF hand